MSDFWTRNGAVFVVQFLLVITIIIQIDSSLEKSRPGFYGKSRTKLKELASMDFQTAEQLRSFKEYLETQSPLMEIVNRYLEDFANCTKPGTVMTDHSEEVIRNPLARFKLVARIVNFFRSMKKEPIGIPGLAVNKVEEEFRTRGPPLKADLIAAADAILRIHFTYGLNATELASGRVRGRDTGVRLLSVDCFFIQHRAQSRAKFSLAFDWLREALRLAPVDASIDNSVVRTSVIGLLQSHNRAWEQEPLSKQNLFMKPLSSMEVSEKTVKTRDVLYKQYAGKGRNCSYWLMNKWGLCAGETFHTPQATAQLFCWLEFKINKLLTIGPLKMEFLSRNPDIVQTHQAFSQKDVNSMATDETQTVHYLPGSRSNSFKRGESETEPGALMVVFLNTVEEGGATVFPGALAAAVPGKGSAIFWFNTLSDGTPDILTEQSDCPVVLGEKLITYRRLQLSDVSSGRQCLLKPKERFKVRVNGKALPVPAPFKTKPADEECDEPKHLFVATGAPAEHHPVGRGHRPVSRYGYTPTTSLKPLIRLDWEIYQHIKNLWKAYVATGSSHASVDDQEGVEMVERYLQDFNETAYNVLAHVTNIEQIVNQLAWNPFAAYRTVWRFENYVKKWANEDPRGHTTGLLLRRIREHVTKVYNARDGPSSTGLEDAMAGILNIQFVYDLKSADMAEGTVAGTNAEIILSARQCTEIGIHAVATNFFYQAVQWLDTAINKIIAQGDTGGVLLEEAQTQLEIAKMAHTRLLAEPNFGPDGNLPPESLQSLSNSTHAQVFYSNFRFVNDEGVPFPSFLRNCQGHPPQTTEEKSKLFCWQETQSHPYLRIRPAKAEILTLHPKPEIVLYHDLLGPQLLSYLTNDSNKNYNFSTSSMNGGTNSNTRLSATSYIYPSSSKESLGIFQVINRVTGLDVMRQSIKIMSYTPGGQFLQHTDTGGYDIDGREAFIATLMFYANDVQQGGGTSFTQADVFVPAVPGSALFWYHTDSAGVRDVQTYHGGCPIIFGEKLIATHFIHYVDQEHLQCYKDPKRKIEVLVNGKSKYQHNI